MKTILQQIAENNRKEEVAERKAVIDEIKNELCLLAMVPESKYKSTWYEYCTLCKYRYQSWLLINEYK